MAIRARCALSEVSWVVVEAAAPQPPGRPFYFWMILWHESIELYPDLVEVRGSKESGITIEQLKQLTQTEEVKVLAMKLMLAGMG